MSDDESWTPPKEPRPLLTTKAYEEAIQKTSVDDKHEMYTHDMRTALDTLFVRHKLSEKEARMHVDRLIEMASIAVTEFKEHLLTREIRRENAIVGPIDNSYTERMKRRWDVPSVSEVAPYTKGEPRAGRAMNEPTDIDMELSVMRFAEAKAAYDLLNSVQRHIAMVSVFIEEAAQKNGWRLAYQGEPNLEAMTEHMLMLKITNEIIIPLYALRLRGENGDPIDPNAGGTSNPRTPPMQQASRSATSQLWDGMRSIIASYNASSDAIKLASGELRETDRELTLRANSERIATFKMANRDIMRIGKLCNLAVMTYAYLIESVKQRYSANPRNRRGAILIGQIQEKGGDVAGYLELLSSAAFAMKTEKIDIFQRGATMFQ